jgi:hypothetical protein
LTATDICEPETRGVRVSRLITARGDGVIDPDEAAIRSTIEGMSDCDSDFTILEQDEEHFIQAAGCSSDGFVLEYQDGSFDDIINARTSSFQRTL